MTTPILMPSPRQKFTDSSGKPLANGMLFTYAAGTSTPQAAYQDPAGTVAHPNPIRLDARGEATAYFIGNYKIDLKTSAGNQVAGYPVDNFNTDPLGLVGQTSALGASLAAETGAALVGFRQAGAGSIATTVTEVLQREVSVWDFMSPALKADALSGSPVMDHAPAWNLAIASLNGSGKVTIPRKRTAKYLLKSTVYMGTSNSVDSSVVLDFESGTLVFTALPDVLDVAFSMKNVPGHFNNQGLKNLHLQCTNNNGTAVKMNGQCFGSFENCYFELFNVGIYFSNEGSGVFNEFVRFSGIELHLCKTGILMSQDGGTDTSMHGVAFRNTTINVGATQTGLQLVDVCWYNADFDLKFFSQVASEAIIKMTTSAPTANKGVFGSGSLTCEGDAKMIGTGRFYLHGDSLFMSGVTDTLSSPDAWEQGFFSYSYVKPRAFGSSGMTTAEIKQKSGQFPSTGPDGSFVRLTAANNQSLLANSFAPHATSPGNGFYTGYTGFQQNYEAGALGWFMASDGTEIKSFAPAGTNCTFRAGANGNPYGDNIAWSAKDGKFLIGGSSAVLTGSGSPNGTVTGSPGDMYLNRSGGANTTLYIKESGAGTNTGWVGK